MTMDKIDLMISAALQVIQLREMPYGIGEKMLPGVREHYLICGLTPEDWDQVIRGVEGEKSFGSPLRGSQG